MEEGPLNLSYKQWFMIALLVLVNVIILGCVLLAMANKIYIG